MHTKGYFRFRCEGDCCQETVVSMDNIKIPKKVTAELQECAGAPLINGKVDEAIITY